MSADGNKSMKNYPACKARYITVFQKLAVPKEEDLRLMEAKIASLTKEMRKKDRTLKQLNALLPWKQSGEGGKEADQNSNDICNLSEDEFIV